MAAPPRSPRRWFFPAPPSDFYVFSAEHFISSDFGFSLSEAFPRLSAFCPPCPVPSDLPVSFSRLSTPWARRMIPFSVFRYEKSCDLNERSLGSRAFLPFIKSFGKGDGGAGEGGMAFFKRGSPSPAVILTPPFVSYSSGEAWRFSQRRMSFIFLRRTRWMDLQTRGVSLLMPHFLR